MAQFNKGDLNNKVQLDFLTYANAVIKSRAIPNVKDNLKPVHRRILFAMDDLGLNSTKKTKKSARIVGDVIGKYHPHGDTSVYDAMIRLSQPWKMRYPLVEVQGNGGSISGDSAAAMRYTEAKLSKFGDLMLHGIDKGAVKFKPSYDESGLEPIVLPSIFPNILCNANDGIAVGLSTNLAPHNLKEVVDAIVAYINFKGITIEQLMKFIPGPDYPTGGTIINAEKLRELYSTGSGTVPLRSKYNIETKGGVQHIVITEVPYLVSIDSQNGLIDQLKKLVIEDGFDLIDDLQDASGNNKVNIRIILKKGANVYKVLETLWQNTRLQITQRISNTIIVDGKPKVLNLKEMIEQYVLHRHEVIINISKNDLEKTQNKIMVTSALLKALAEIDKVISLIKESNDKAEARKRLIEQLDINEYQANAILDMKLSKLSRLDGIELKDELAELQKKEKELLNLISNESARENQMRMELLQMSTKYADPRRTILTYGGVEEGLPIEDIKVLMFDNGATFATQRKLEDLDIKRKTSQLNSSGVSLVVETKTDKTLSVFTKDGAISNHKILTMTSENMEMGMFTSAPLLAIDFDDSKSLKEYIVFVTSAGIVKKTKTSEYANSKNGSRTIKLKGDQELIFVGMGNDDDNLLILDDKLAYFKVSEITATSKITIGSKGIASGRAISAAIIGDKDKVFMLSADGKGKLTAAKDFVSTAKGSNGQVIAEGTVLLAKKQDYYFIYDGSKNNLITSNPMTKGKTATGSKIISGTPICITK